MRKTFLILALALGSLPLWAQKATVLRQQSLSRWNIGTANYSGITSLGGNRYALVSDDEAADGFFIFRIDLNPSTGEIVSVYLEDWKGNAEPQRNANGRSVRDCEAIAYHPSTNTLFIVGEGDQSIWEYTLEGQTTGRQLSIPKQFRTIVKNGGFESLTFCQKTNRFWTTTEMTLPADGTTPSATHPGTYNLLRLQSFGEDLAPLAQYAYRTEAGRSSSIGETYAHGVSDLCALPDGRLVVMEREANIRKNYIGSECVVRLYVVNPEQAQPIAEETPLSQLSGSQFLVKQLIATFTTRIHTLNFANYEGLCLGPRLADGRQTLILVSDSQGGAGNDLYRLKDYLKVIVLPLGY